MKPRTLTNNDLDSLGRLVVKAGAVSDDEIEKIVSNPRLFDGVLSKIAAEPVRRAQARSIWKPMIASAAAVVVASVSMIGYLRFANGDAVTAKRILPTVYSVEKAKVPFEPGEPERVPPNDKVTPIQAVYVQAVEKPVERKPRRQPVKPVQPREAVFHAIGLTANAEDAVLDGRVVRVEMPRSALFALGVDLPLENSTKAVKADLLVGADGIPRGIRLVE